MRRNIVILCVGVTVCFIASFHLGFSAEVAGAVGSQQITLLTDDIVVQDSGLFDKTVHIEIKAPNSASASKIGQQSIVYSDSMEEVEVVEAYTRKSNGRKLVVGADAIHTQAPQGSPQVPLFDDRRQKVIIFPDVDANDSVVYTYITHVKQSYFKGHFWDMDAMPTGIPIHEVRKSITVPKNFSLQVETHGMGFERQEAADKIVYRWHYSAPAAQAEDVSVLSQWDKWPRMFASTFKDYEEFARVYAAIAAPMMIVTPKIQSLANEITATTEDRRLQAQQIYEWISKRIRYVAVELGQGAVIPHAADTVLANGYGDCKDHAVLFSALLKAKSIDSEIVLINAANSYTLSGPPTLAQLNHAIIWLPEFKLYADTTVGVAPFGTLLFSEYGKPAVHTFSQDSVLRHTPLLPEKEATFTFKTVSRISSNGKLVGESETMATGPYSVILRQIGTTIQAMGPKQAAVAYFRKAGIAGTGSFELSPPTDLASSYIVKSRFELEPPPGMFAGGFPMPSGMRLIGFTGDGLMGPLFDRNLKSTEPTPCYSGHVVEDLSLEPPPGKRFAKVPEDQTVQNENILFTARWSQAGRLMNVRREFLSTIDQPICKERIRESMAKSLPKVAETYPTQLILVDD